VATRYLQAEGVSHSHLYLYTEDGKFVRQLTRFDMGQDHAPVFSADGDQIVFTHINETSDGKDVVEAASKEPDSIEFWQVNTRGGGLKRLTSAPDWYKAATNASFFTAWPPKDWPENQRMYGWADKGWDQHGNPLPGILEKAPASFTSPDGHFELTLKLGPDDLEENGPGNGELYELKDLRSGKSWRLGEMPDFVGLTNLLHFSADQKELFLQQGPLNVVFFSLHMGSSFGEETIALNLTKPKLIVLPGNEVPLPFGKEGPDTDQWFSLVRQCGNADPIPLSGEPCFLALCIKRYEPIPGSSKTASLSYLGRFDASLEQTPYVSLGTAPNFYGACVFRPGKTPAVMKIGEDIGDD